MTTSIDLAGLLARLPSAPTASPSLASGAPGAIPGAASPVGAAGFENVVTKFLDDVNQQQLKADTAVEELATGKTNNVHDVVLTAVKADLSVRMLVEIRNQLVSSYQEIMRMQL